MDQADLVASDEMSLLQSRFETTSHYAVYAQ